MLVLLLIPVQVEQWLWCLQGLPRSPGSMGRSRSRRRTPVFSYFPICCRDLLRNPFGTCYSFYLLSIYLFLLCVEPVSPADSRCSLRDRIPADGHSQTLCGRLFPALLPGAGELEWGWDPTLHGEPLQGALPPEPQLLPAAWGSGAGPSPGPAPPA